MKDLIFIIALFIIGLVITTFQSCCCIDTQKTKYYAEGDSTISYRLIVIDNHQYLFKRGGYSIAHKGGCPQCQLELEETIRKVLKESPTRVVRKEEPKNEYIDEFGVKW